MSDEISKKKSFPNVSIIILNWNGWKDTIECLESLYQINYTNYNIILVDNGSTDESIEKIKKYCWINDHIKIKNIFEYKEKNFISLTEHINQNSYNKELILIKNSKNYGYAKGNNIGMRFASKVFKPDYFFLLNNDTIVDKEFLIEIVKVAKNHDVGSVQSVLLKPGGKIIDSLGQELTKFSARDIGMNLEYKKLNDNREIFGACAAAALYKADVLEDINFFDEDFFTMYEDVDLSWRLRLRGYKSILATNSIVYHKRGLSKIMANAKKSYLLINYYQGYNISKNLILLAIKYNSLYSLFNIKYLSKLLIALGGLFYFSLRVKKLRYTFSIILRNIKLRKEIQKNPLFKGIKKKWTIK